MGRKAVIWLALLALAWAVSGCATSQPPEEIRSAVSVVNRYTAEYVTEANKKQTRPWPKAAAPMRGA